MKPTLRRNLYPILLALVAVSASLAQSLSRGFPPQEGRTDFIPPAYSPIPGPTEGQLHSAFAGRTLIRTDPRGFQRLVALHGARGRLITGPALAALVMGGPPERRASPDKHPARSAARGSGAARPGSPRGTGGEEPLEARPDSARLCDKADSLARRACLDSLASARAAETGRRNGDSDRRNGDAAAAQGDSTVSPRALREIEARRDTVYLGPDGEEVERPPTRDAASTEDEVQAARTQGYIGQLFVDMGNGGDWNWGDGDWAVIIYVVVGVIVVGAFVLGGGKALYDLVVNREEAPVFKEVGARFSYSGLSMYGNDGTPLFRDARLYGLRFALGVERSIMSLGLAAEGGSVNLSVRGLAGARKSLDFQGAYLVGGPLVRFGNYHPLAFTLEFLNGTSNHRSIGWISKSRMTLAGKTRQNLLVGAHLGAVFYDLRFTDGLVFRRGDLNRDLSMMVGLDLGYAF